MKVSSVIISTCLLTQLVACGPGGNSKNSILSDELVAPEYIPPDNLEVLETETYLAVLTSVNPKVGGTIVGSLTVHKDRDFMVADVRVSGSAPNTVHAQNIHYGTVCPTKAADVNLDGVIDVEEALYATGNVVIPLDGDINSQYSMLGTFPLADSWGSYIYTQTTSFERFLEDIKGEDENPNDNVSKLSNASLGLAGKVVMIHGTADFVHLPSTVATNEGLTANQTLPIACGYLKPVKEVPGTFEPDDITYGTTRSGDDTPGLETRPGSDSGSRHRRVQPGTKPEGQ